MRPNRRVAILFLVTLLSTRFLHAEVTRDATPEMAGVGQFNGDKVTAGERSGRVAVQEGIKAQLQSQGGCTGVAPVIISPADRSTQAAPVKLVWAAALGALNYTIHYSIKDAGEDHGDVTLTTTSLLTLQADFPAANDLEWWIEANFAGCKVSTKRLHITVTAPPVCLKPGVTVAPVPSIITAGNTATLVATVTGTSPVVVTWYEGTPGNRSTIAGTGLSFKTPALTTTKQYWCEATNACGSAQSPVITLNLCAPPVITGTIADRAIDPGTATRLTVVAAGSAPLAYQWYEGDAGDRSKPVGPNAATFDTDKLTRATKYWVEVRNSCGTAMSNAAAVSMNSTTQPPTPPPSDPPPGQNPSTPPPPAPCTDALVTPRPAAVAQASSGVGYDLVWPATPQTSFAIDEATDPSFANAMRATTTATRLTFAHEAAQIVTYYYRVRGIRTCDGATTDFSQTVAVRITPAATSGGNSTDVIAPAGSTTPVVRRVHLAQPLGSFAVAASEPWITVAPSMIVIGPDGADLTLTFDPRLLGAGTSTATLLLSALDASHSRITTMATRNPLAVPVSISLVTPIVPGSAPANAAGMVVVPVAAHAEGNASSWRTDLRLAHDQLNTVQYELTYGGKQTTMSVPAGTSLALDDVIDHWFGESSAGMLFIRPVDAAAASIRTFASARLYNATGDGTYGQLVPAMPLAKFMTSVQQPQTLMQLAQTATARTNVGVAEVSGNAATVKISAFDDNGAKLFEQMVDLAPRELKQFGSMLAEHGITSASARMSVEVLSPNARVGAYASVVDNRTGDPSFITAETFERAASSRRVLAGVADLAAADGRWTSDVRLFNATAAPIDVTLRFFEQMSSEAKSERVITVAPGETKVFDDAVHSMFDLTSTSGAIQVDSSATSGLFATARTYYAQANGSFGQFIEAVDDSNAASLGSAPLRMLQIEESPRFRTNVGLVEVSGRPATVEITANLPGQRTSPTISVDLKANEYRQLNSVLRSMGLSDAYNALVSVRVVGGDGRVAGYGSVVDNVTNDPTYVGAQ